MLRRCAAGLGHGARLGGLALLLVLSGCGTLSSINPFSSKGEESAAACPTSTILRPLAQTAVFAKPGPGLRPTDVAIYGIISEIDAKCTNSAGTLRASLDVIIAAERGPANKSGDVDLTYFLGVVGADQQILSKKSFGVHISIPQGARRAGVTDHIEETIPLNGQAIANVQIVAGFQQSADAVDFYEHFRGR
jgi:hypothetical protein